MRAFHLTAPGSANLRRVEVDDPRPGPGEVLVRLRAASLNYLDLAVARGEFGPCTYPVVPVTDGAGDIAALGDGVEGWAVGERVVPAYLPDWVAGGLTVGAVRRMRGVTMQGSAAELAAVPAGSLAAMPAHLSFAEAATLPIAATTAWSALRAANITVGSTVAVLGTGGVSLFALQFARAAGARTLVISSSEEKLARARALGADETIDYRRTPAWDEEMLRLTGGAGVDLVVETVGPATFRRSLNAAGLDATVYVVGFVSGIEAALPLLQVMTKRLRVVGSQTGSVATFREAVRAVGAARITPVIDRTFGFDDLPAAYAHLDMAGHVGKVAVDVAMG